MTLLNKIDSPQDLKKLDITQLPQLCNEIRNFMLNTLSEIGGHLSSNLGTIELTVALHYVFNSPNDKFIWDVGHQTYTHKILTGRKNLLHTVRKTGGLSGFPKWEESEHDHYNSGHAGTSISLALGESVAHNLHGKRQKGFSAISIIGDASIANGMAFEAMNHAGHLKTPFLVILNDNDMSISKSVGGLSYVLTSLINTRLYKSWASRWFKVIRWIPLGMIFERLMLRFGSNMKSIITEHQFFEELGFRYLGPLDGHDVIKLVHMLVKLQNLERPTLLHVVTKKGKGYKHAEENPTLYHGVSSFVKSTGEIKSDLMEKPLSELAGESIRILAKKDRKICVITPAMKDGSGLSTFADAYPDRFFDTGISEEHATTFSAALAHGGLHPYLCIYSTFLQRSYDQLIHDIALMNLPVKIVIDRAGLVGGDGETHQGVFDIAYMNPIPNIALLSPSSPEDLVLMLSYMQSYDRGPIALRLPRTSVPTGLYNNLVKSAVKPVSVINAKVAVKGTDAVILCEGFLLKSAVEAARKLISEKISLEVVAIRSIKPLDTKTLEKSIQGKKFVFTLENHGLSGGIGSIIENKFSDQLRDKIFNKFGYPEKFIEHGNISDIQKKYGLDTNSIAESIKAIIQSQRKPDKKVSNF